MKMKYQFIISLLFIITLFIILNPTYATMGGISLLFGNYFLFRGQILFSTPMYVIADLCWSAMAYEGNDTFGMVCVNVGIITGLWVTYKIKKGEFVKDLHNKNRK